MQVLILRLLRSRKIVRREHDIDLDRSSTRTAPPASRVNAISNCLCKVLCGNMLTKAVRWRWSG